MKNREIYNIKNKNSKEILLYLQKKDFEKNNNYLSNEYRKKFFNKKFVEENTNEENLPKTRMKQFLNKSFFEYEGKSPSKSLTNETKEYTPIISTPEFILNNSPIQIEINQNNSQFSFSKENNNDNDNEEDSLNYLDFHLHLNINKSSKDNNHYHVYLPEKYKDDEDYKSRLYKYLKCETERNPSYHLFGIKTKKISPKRNLSKINKIKKLYSVKKKDMNKIIFFGNNEEKVFDFYRDENIGIDKNWQISALYKYFDYDVESDDEQIENAKSKMLDDLTLGIMKWSQNKNNCFNYQRLNSPIEIESIKRFSSSA